MNISFISNLLAGAGRFFGLIAVLAALAAVPAAAQSLSLDDARAQGLIGERADGLVGAVGSAPSSEVTALVETVNRQRMANYRAIAAKNGTPVEAVQAIAGETQVKRARDSGWFVMDTSGVWTKN